MNTQNVEKLIHPPLLMPDQGRLAKAFRSGDPFVWLAGSASALTLFMILLLLGMVFLEGATFFWPRPILKVTLKDSTVLAGIVRNREVFEEKDAAGRTLRTIPRLQLMTGNRDLGTPDFVWVDVPEIVKTEAPADLVWVERREWGPMVGTRVSAPEKDPLVFKTAAGAEMTLDSAGIVRIVAANRMGFFGKVSVYLARLAEFIFGAPRESNTEGGVFPALFGTVMMTLIMIMVVVPLGVLAALYLREYAKQGVMVSAVRIAVNNLAGVPSIVFGIFGLGFFVYGVGGAIDRLFFASALPTPTFGTGGILWASLTLALLTIPVVIVSTEEALAFVPRQIRDGSIACGASKWQTIRHVVLPGAAPGILTGVILAMARGAGEVAPLMITGVVKLAPGMPFDFSFPFFHFERKFMHLGFHIYDVGFQSPNVEAAMPMVYTTTLLLILLIVGLNLSAIFIRNHLRSRYKTSTF